MLNPSVLFRRKFINAYIWNITLDYQAWISIVVLQSGCRVELPNQLAEVEFPNELMGDRIAQSARGSSRDNAPTIFFNIMINEFAHITYLIILYLRFCFLKNTMVIEKLFIYLLVDCCCIPWM